MPIMPNSCAVVSVGKIPFSSASVAFAAWIARLPIWSVPALVAGDGQPIPAAELGLWRRRARLVGLSLESNGAICRALLHARHGVEDPTQEVPA